MQSCEGVVHLAARAHQVDKGEGDARALYRGINVEGTRRVLEAAWAAGIKKFIYLSSVKAAGEWNPPGEPFREGMSNRPEDEYGRSKEEAERLVQAYCESHGMQYWILRPPLVYGPGVKANFYRLMEAVAKGRWLPLGGIQNRRSFCYVGNLVDATLYLVTAEKADSGIYYVADNEVVSTTELARRMGDVLGNRARLFPMPSVFVRLLARLAGKKDLVKKLFGDLEVDTHKLRGLGWHPPFTISEGLEKTVCWYRE